MKKVLLVIVLVCLPTLLHAQGVPIPWVRPQPLKNNGSINASGFLCTYLAGGFSNATTYSDSALSSTLPNPIRLNSAGRPQTGTSGVGTETQIYVQPGTALKYILYAAGTGNSCNGVSVGSAIWTQDNIPAPIGQLTTTDCSIYPGSTAGAKITACMAGLPSTGGVADARKLEGTQTLSTITMTRDRATLLLGAGTFTGNIIIQCQWCGVTADPYRTQIVSTTGYAVQCGDTDLTVVGTTYQGNQVRGLTITATGTGGIVAHRCTQFEADHNVINGASSYGIRLVGSDQTGHLHDNQIGTASSSSSPTVGISVENGSNQVNIYSNQILATQSGIQAFNTVGIWIYNNSVLGTWITGAGTFYGVRLRADQAFPAYLTWVPANISGNVWIEDNIFEFSDNAGATIIDILIGDGSTTAKVLRTTVKDNVHWGTTLATRYPYKVDYANQTYIRTGAWNSTVQNIAWTTVNAIRPRIDILTRSVTESTLTSTAIKDDGATAPIFYDCQTNAGECSFTQRQRLPAGLYIGSGGTFGSSTAEIAGDLSLRGFSSTAPTLTLQNAAGNSSCQLQNQAASGSSSMAVTCDTVFAGAVKGASYFAAGTAGTDATLSCSAGQAVKTITVIKGIVTAVTCGAP